ncbi:MAG: protein kinase, partial [Chloroflexota bacterium]
MGADHPIIASRFKVGSLIGVGATGSVYLGVDTLTGQQVAVKALRQELIGRMPELVERFRREGEALRRLNHPNIVKVLAAAQEAGQPYIVMEYVSGGSLANLMEQQPYLPLDRAVAIALELADALSRAHHLDILHRDIKPANILLAPDGTPRLTDFGLARLGDQPALTTAGTVLGTFQYLSPEAWHNQKLDARTDIWSFGVVLYQMLAGQLPFGGDTAMGMMWSIHNQPLPDLRRLRADLPAELVELVGKMLRRDLAARLPSARLVGAELELIQKKLHQTGAKRAPVLSAAAAPPKIRLLIVDDHAVVRQGLRTLIDLQDDMTVVGEGASGAEAIELAGRLQPDIILLDLVMPQLDGVAATPQILERCPRSRVLILTSFGEDDKVFPAIRAGAQGYLLKDIHPANLVQAIRDAHQGKTQLHPDIAQKLLSTVATA